MRRIRLCIVTTVPISVVSFYGKQLDYLKEHGFDITVITSPDPILVEKISKACSLILVPISRKITPIKDIISFCRVANIIKGNSFDIIQYSSPKAALLSSICAFIFRVPVRIYLMWGIYYTGKSGIKRAALKIIERITCFFSTHILPDSKSNYEFALAEGLSVARKMSVVGVGSANGVDLKRFNPENPDLSCASIRKELCITDDSIVIGFVGRLCREKGINELVKAFLSLSREYKNIYLLLVGPYSSDSFELNEEVQLAIDTNSRIISVGYKENPEEYMICMDIFVLPSYREGFGMVNIEASAMGIPVVSTDIPGPKDSVLNGKTGILVPPREIYSLRESIRKLCADVRLRKEMGKSGREWAKNFNQELLWRQIRANRLEAFDSSRKEISFVKRVTDVVMALSLLFIFTPLMLLISFLIIIHMGWPIVFVQLRPGLRCNLFKVYKFRTMLICKNSESMLSTDAKRITLLGSLLRRLSLDELPELINVVKGDMSLVGPRPLLPQYISRYTPEQSRRHNVIPGITGWAQIHGRNSIDWQEKLVLDLWYVDNRSFWLDIKIFFSTIPKILKSEGIRYPGQATCIEFKRKDGE